MLVAGWRPGTGTSAWAGGPGWDMRTRRDVQHRPACPGLYPKSRLHPAAPHHPGAEGQLDVLGLQTTCITREAARPRSVRGLGCALAHGCAHAGGRPSVSIGGTRLVRGQGWGGAGKQLSLRLCVTWGLGAVARSLCSLQCCGSVSGWPVGPPSSC